MGTPPPLVEFEPVAVGPLQISHLSAEGGVLALAFLLALALSSHMARRLAVPRALVFDLFAVVAPVVLSVATSLLPEMLTATPWLPVAVLILSRISPTPVKSRY